VTRFALALAVLVSGCGTGGYHVPYHNGHAANPTGGDVAFLAADVAAGALDRNASRRLEPERRRPSLAERQPWRRIFGTVRWSAGGRLAGMPVLLKGRSGSVLRQTTTDRAGRFWFPLPLPPDWYQVSVRDERGVGEARVWLHDEPPDFLEVVVAQ